MQTKTTNEIKTGNRYRVYRYSRNEGAVFTGDSFKTKKGASNRANSLQSSYPEFVFSVCDSIRQDLCTFADLPKEKASSETRTLKLIPADLYRIDVNGVEAHRVAAVDRNEAKTLLVEYAKAVYGLSARVYETSVTGPNVYFECYSDDGVTAAGYVNRLTLVTL